MSGRRVERRLAGIGAALLLVLASGASGAAQGAEPARVSYEDAVPGVAPADVDSNAVYYDQAGREITSGGSGLASTAETSVSPQAIGCTPGSGRDNPHPSSGDVSGHGWWTKGTCTADTAHVYNCLYEYYTDGSFRQKACSETVQVGPGGGRGKRSTARATCSSTLTTTWRNHVDVDVDGQIDTGEQPYNAATIACRVN